MTHRETEPTPLQSEVLAIAERYAATGEQLPTDGEIGAEIGKSGGAVTSAFHSLACKNYLELERYGRVRVVTICRTGKRTGMPDADTVRKALEGPTYADRDCCFKCGSRADACLCGKRGV